MNWHSIEVLCLLLTADLIIRGTLHDLLLIIESLRYSDFATDACIESTLRNNAEGNDK